MVVRARLSAPRQERDNWPWHHAKWTALSASLLMWGDRRMEAENYLAGGYGIRLALEARKTGWSQFVELANVWKPGRAKGILVSENFGVPFLAATQVFDLRPVARKWVSAERTKDADVCMSKQGQVVVTCSGSVGRSTILSAAHDGMLVSNDLLRVDSKESKYSGWIYAWLRAPQTRAMMNAAQYGHIIKHLEVSHLNKLPIPVLRDELLEDFCIRVQAVLDARNQAHLLLVEAESRFAEAIGNPVISEIGENGFSIRASSMFTCRRRMEGFFHNPAVRAVREHFSARKLNSSRLGDSGFDVWLPNRFKRINAEDGVCLLDSSDLFEINPDIGRRIADSDFGDPCKGRVKAGWLMVSRSGQIYGLNGSVAIANGFHEGKVVSDDVIRIAPRNDATIRPGYLFIAMSHPTLGRPLVKAQIYGSSIPHLDVSDVLSFEIVRLDKGEESVIADLAEQSAELLAKADLLEIAIASDAEIIIDRFIAGDMQDVVLTSRA